MRDCPLSEVYITALEGNPATVRGGTAAVGERAATALPIERVRVLRGLKFSPPCVSHVTHTSKDIT